MFEISTRFGTCCTFGTRTGQADHAKPDDSLTTKGACELPTLEKFENITHEQAQAKIAVLPARIVYDAQFALQQLKESNLPIEEQTAIIEPLARAVGWVEALVFAFDKTTERDAVRAMLGNGRKTV